LRAATVLALVVGIAGAPCLAQTPGGSDAPSAAVDEKAPPPSYKPPLRGAPGGRVGGASRSIMRVSAPLPSVELLAPADHAGVTAIPSPTLLFFVSRPVTWQTQLAISAQQRSAPLVEIAIPSPQAIGIHAIRLADYGIRLQPGILYTWSIAILLDQRNWAHNIVGSATIVYEPANTAGQPLSAPPLRRAAVFADTGLWYDAVAAAVEGQTLDRGAALNGLLRQVGLTDAVGP
jgi:hypothetical protein